MTQQPGETMNAEQTLQAALAAADAALNVARARLADIPREVQALRDEEQRLTAMLSGVTPRNALGKAHNPAINEQSKLDCFRIKHGNAGLDIVRDIVSRGGEIDLREVKHALGMAPDARGIWPRSNLIPAVLRSLGCTETAHAEWLAPR